ncbi:ribonucleotide-diphosphate reductase subunit beta [Ampullimonas aquatilis]|uniref:ribonucleotide-diphosphate reductase subunit beta n=1 Tax=Ampullimonas aquatilis TaxID=1341549 RepID=UPI003C79112D
MNEAVQLEAAQIVMPGLNYDAPIHTPVEWDNGTWSIQHWLERTAWKTLKDTKYGRNQQESFIPDLLEDPLLRQVYMLDVALFIAAEKTSADAVAGMMKIAPDEQSFLYLATQVLDESRHHESFCRRMADFGVTPEERKQLVTQYTTPGMRKMFDLILEQVDKGDFYAASLAQNLVLEGMAYPLYRYEIRYWSKIDPNLSKIIKVAFADEAHHVGFGEAIASHRLKSTDVDKRNQFQKLMHDFSSLMQDTFDQVIHHYVGLYQVCADNHMDVMGDIDIFPGIKMRDVSEEDQIRLLLKDIEDEHSQRLARIGL